MSDIISSVVPKSSGHADHSPRQEEKIDVFAKNFARRRSLGPGPVLYFLLLSFLLSVSRFFIISPPRKRSSLQKTEKIFDKDAPTVAPTDSSVGATVGASSTSLTDRSSTAEGASSVPVPREAGCRANADWRSAIAPLLLWPDGLEPPDHAPDSPSTPNGRFVVNALGQKIPRPGGKNFPPPPPHRRAGERQTSGALEIYSFGVYNGESIRQIRENLHPVVPRIWGFDSFSGLPAEDASDVRQTDWGVGKYKSALTPQQIEVNSGGQRETKLFKGFFADSLTPNLKRREGMGTASFVEIDADLYISSKQALQWLFEEEIAQVGTLVGYDDWWAGPCSSGGELLEPFDIGEGRAHLEITEQFGLVWRCVAGGCQFDADGTGFSRR